MEEDFVSPEDPSTWRLNWYPRLLLGALGLALLIIVATGDGSATAGGRVGGDYPAFYGAGSIVLDGDLDRLYDPAVQNDAQVDLLGDETGYLAFAYPPHVAVAYTPLAALPYRISYLVHTALMTGAVLAALALIRPMLGVVDRWYWVTAAAALSVFPVFRAVGAGQNTALTLLLIAVVWRALSDDRELIAGVAAGLLLFRPQYAIPIIGLLFIGGNRRAVAAAVSVAVGTWLANAALLGPGWFSGWLDEVGSFIETDAEVNAHNSVSWLGFGRAVLGPDAGTAVGGLLAIATAGVLVAMWWRSDRFDLVTRIAATTVGVVLMSPHAMFYDAGLLVIPVLVAIDRGWLGVRAAAAFWALALGHLVAGELGATPLAILVGAGFMIVLANSLTAPSDGPIEPVEVPA